MHKCGSAYQAVLISMTFATTVSSRSKGPGTSTGRNMIELRQFTIDRSSLLEYSFGCLKSIPQGSPVTTQPKVERFP